MTQVIIVDVDGTLVDTNYQHALAWFRAFRRHDVVLPLWRIHRHVGMGGDQLVAALGGDDLEGRHGESLRDAWVEEFDPMLPEVCALEGATELLGAIRKRGLRLVLASSGKPHHVDHFLDLVDGRDVAEAWTSSEDVESTKPAPDLLAVALDRIGGADADGAVMVGDSTWDCLAARNAGLPSVALRTGGFSPEELRAAGASSVYDSLLDMTADLVAWTNATAAGEGRPPG